MLDKKCYDGYIQVLEEELVTALGCTEPIAIAYAGAVARKHLGREPERLVVRCSGNIIKNVKGVTVPNSGGQKGVEVAAILGVLGGDPERQLEVLVPITAEQIERSRALVAGGMCTVELAEGVANLYICLEARAGEDTVSVEIADKHTNIVHIVKNGVDVLAQAYGLDDGAADHKRDFMSVGGILDFAGEVKIEDVKELLDHQIACNMAIAQEGLTNPYGANVGKNLLELYGDERVEVKAKACLLYTSRCV